MEMRTAGVVGLILIGLLTVPGSMDRFPEVPRRDPRVTRVSFETTRELEAFYRREEYGIDDARQGEYVVVQRLPRDFHTIRDVARKKRLFHAVVLPIVYLENERIADLRGWIESLWDQFRQEGTLSRDERTLLTGLLKRYRVLSRDRSGPLELSDDHFQALCHRVSPLPPSLVVAQAVNESGWGTSRFSREANNLFGQYTYRENAGMKPRGTLAGENVRLRIFPSLRASVRSYMHNLNSGWAYKELRRLRSANPRSMEPLRLVQGLTRYSEQGQTYVNRIERLIRYNDYGRFDRF